MLNDWKKIYEANSIKITNFITEKESSDYFACEVSFNGTIAKFRVAKITPKKIGQFVTLWKRENNGPIQPFDVSDDIEFIIISVQKEANFGHFIFPKKVLIEKGIFTAKKEGKRAIRVYPPWDIAENPQAKRTQKWMLNYFQNLSLID